MDLLHAGSSSGSVAGVLQFYLGDGGLFSESLPPECVDYYLLIEPLRDSSRRTWKSFQNNPHLKTCINLPLHHLGQGQKAKSPDVMSYSVKHSSSNYANV